MCTMKSCFNQCFFIFHHKKVEDYYCIVSHVSLSILDVVVSWCKHQPASHCTVHNPIVLRENKCFPDNTTTPPCFCSLTCYIRLQRFISDVSPQSLAPFMSFEARITDELSAQATQRAHIPAYRIEPPHLTP